MIKKRSARKTEQELKADKSKQYIGARVDDGIRSRWYYSVDQAMRENKKMLKHGSYRVDEFEDSACITLSPKEAIHIEIPV